MGNKYYWMIGALIFAAVPVSGQGRGGGTPNPTMPNDAQVQEWAHQNQMSRDRFQELGLGGKEWKTNEKLRTAFRQFFDANYRKPTKEEMQLVTPDAGDAAKFETVLKMSGAGMVKLLPNAGCQPNVAAAPQCLKYTMPGGASSFSFRLNSYRVERLADLTYTGERFLTNGTMTLGILADIGDVPMDQVSMSTKGAEYVGTFQPADEMQAAGRLTGDLLKGVERDGFLYKRAVPAKTGTTYLLRSMAYSEPSYQVLEGITFDEFGFDERRDVTIAFRVVRRDDDGAVTILYRKLADKKAPTFKHAGK